MPDISSLQIVCTGTDTSYLALFLQLSSFFFNLHSSCVWNETVVRFTNHFILQSSFRLSLALAAFVFNTHPLILKIFQ